MKNEMNYLLFAFGAATTVAAVFLFSRSFRRQTVAIAEKTEKVIDAKMSEGIKDSLDEASKLIDNGAAFIKGAIKRARK